MTDLGRSRLRWLSFRRTLSRLGAKLGRRGGTLWDLGIIWILMGVFVAITGGVVGRPPAPHERLPDGIREIGWILTGLIAAMSAFLRKPGQDRWGFVALILMPAERTASWTAASLINFTGWLPEPWNLTNNLAVPGLVQSVSAALVWLTVTRLVLRISGWCENDPTRLSVE